MPANNREPDLSWMALPLIAATFLVRVATERVCVSAVALHAVNAYPWMVTVNWNGPEVEGQPSPMMNG